MTLRDKLKALTEPSREVDVEIAKSFDEVSLYFTASLDATVELVEREMPGWWWALERVEGEHWAYIGGDTSCVEARRKHKLPAVALLLALLEAKGIE